MHEGQDLVNFVVFILFEDLCLVLIDLVLCISHECVLLTSAELFEVTPNAHIRDCRWLLQVRIEEL